MVRSFADPVEVRRRDDIPQMFVWRDQLYVVQEVLAHWFESGRWWRRALAGTAAGAPAGLPGLSDIDDLEQECWRVEAAAGRSSIAGVYDLCFDWSAGRWLLARVQD